LLPCFGEWNEARFALGILDTPYGNPRLAGVATLSRHARKVCRKKYVWHHNYDGNQRQKN